MDYGDTEAEANNRREEKKIMIMGGWEEHIGVGGDKKLPQFVLSKRTNKRNSAEDVSKEQRKQKHSNNGKHKGNVKVKIKKGRDHEIQSSRQGNGGWQSWQRECHLTSSSLSVFKIRKSYQERCYVALCAFRFHGAFW